MAPEPSVIAPKSVGAAALAELGRVTWAELEHAYGIGKVGPALHEDVRASLAALGKPARQLDALAALASNVFHQGTIYEATAPAVAFMLAFAAGPEVARSTIRELLALVAEIVIASAWDTLEPGMTDAFGDEVGEQTRAAVRASSSRLQAIAARVPELAELSTALVQLVGADRLTPALVERGLACLEQLPELDDEPELESEAAGPQWFRHAKWGRAQLVRHEGPDKLRLRFDDGSERVILARFVEPITD